MGHSSAVVPLCQCYALDRDALPACSRLTEIGTAAFPTRVKGGV